jgi:hypothetical protein
MFVFLTIARSRRASSANTLSQVPSRCHQAAIAETASKQFAIEESRRVNRATDSHSLADTKSRS